MLVRDAEALLTDYEKADAKLRAFRQKHAKILDAGEAMHAERARVHDALKALFAPFHAGPPPEADGEKTHVFAKGKSFVVEVQFKKQGDTFDPARLSATVLMSPGVVKAVDAKRVAELEATHPSVAVARCPGEWMTPVVLLKPR